MLKINETACKAIRRDVSKKIRSGKPVTAAEQSAYDRVVAALDYISYRSQRGIRINGWWDLPVAAHMWATDARQIER